MGGKMGRMGAIGLLLITLLCAAATGHTADDEITLMKNAVGAYKNKDYAKAQPLFEEVANRFPNNASANYFLGDIHLQEKRLPDAAKYWRKYVQMDFNAAAAQGVPKRLTILESEVRKTEFQRLMENEEKISKQPPEPNTVAVFPLSNSGDEKYNVLSKGLTALIIADLAKVPGIKVLERQNLQQLEEEIKLSKSNLVEKDTRVRASRLMKAERIMLGDFTIKDK